MQKVWLRHKYRMDVLCSARYDRPGLGHEACNAGMRATAPTAAPRPRTRVPCRAESPSHMKPSSGRGWRTT